MPDTSFWRAGTIIDCSTAAGNQLVEPLVIPPLGGPACSKLQLAIGLLKLPPRAAGRSDAVAAGWGLPPLPGWHDEPVENTLRSRALPNLIHGRCPT